MICHVTPRATWEAARRDGVYRADTLASEGFIHLCDPAQLPGVADRYFRGVPDLVLLCVDPARLAARLVYEDSYGAGETFPHLYGPIELAAVERVVDLAVRPDGRLALPTELEVNGSADGA